MFESKAAFRLAVVSLFVEDNCEALFPQNNKERIKAACKDAACSFYINARVSPSGETRVTSVCLQHSCTPIRVASTKGVWLARLAHEVSGDTDSPVPADVIKRARTNHGLKVTYKQAYRALQRCTAEQMDANEHSYGLVTPWLEAMRRNNPGSRIDSVEEDGKMRGLFLALTPWIHSAAHCLPLISLDACHLSSKAKGTLFLATMLTGNHDVKVVAAGIAPTENGASWSWFIQHLKASCTDLLTRNDVAVISDREKGLASAMDDILPMVPHSFCSFHIKKNVKTRYGTDLYGFIHQLATCLDVNEVEGLLQDCNAIDPEATAYLKGNIYASRDMYAGGNVWPICIQYAWINMYALHNE